MPATLQDGSCNGLQHYAALSRDRVCAAEVNMLPAPLPGDVYSAVARAVTQRVQRDAAAGMSEALKVRPMKSDSPPWVWLTFLLAQLLLVSQREFATCSFRWWHPSTHSVPCLSHKAIPPPWPTLNRAPRFAACAQVLERNSGTIDRKLVKQTVMTTVYGVTQTGAREQISNRLRERGWSNEPEIFQVGIRIHISCAM